MNLSEIVWDFNIQKSIGNHRNLKCIHKMYSIINRDLHPSNQQNNMQTDSHQQHNDDIAVCVCVCVYDAIMMAKYIHMMVFISL